MRGRDGGPGLGGVSLGAASAPPVGGRNGRPEPRIATLPPRAALLALSPVREAAPPWQVLIGPFAAEHIEAELDHGAPLLVVPNDLERAEALAPQFEGRGGGQLFFSRDLLAADDREVCWYRYSDPRFDGVTPPEELHHLAPNLRLRDLELRAVVRLDSLIHGWANRDSALAALVSAGGGRVWLQGKQPLPIVAGVSRVVEVIGEFCWTPLGTPVDPPGGPASQERLAEWLESSGFHPAERRTVNAQSAASSLVWRQDPLRRAAARQQRLEGENERLRQERDGLGQEAEALRVLLAQAEARQAALTAEHAAADSRWQDEREALQQAAVAERSLLEAEVVRLTADGARLTGEGASLRKEVDALRQEAETLRLQITVQQQGLETQRQGLEAEAAAERAAHEAEIVRWAQEGVVQRQEAEALRREAEALRWEVEALRLEGEGLRLEGESLRQEVADRTQVAADQAQEATERVQEASYLRQSLETLQQELDAAAAQRLPLEAEIDRLGQENGTLRQETQAEIAAILALLAPAETLSPTPGAPAAP